MAKDAQEKGLVRAPICIIEQPIAALIRLGELSDTNHGQRHCNGLTLILQTRQGAR